MSGHSKWATIKRKKAATDSKRGKIFTKLLKEIQVAAKLGGGNLDGNARLKTAVAAAKAESVPNDNIERAIKRGSGDSEGENYEDIVYEGFGPGGVAIIVRALSDNRNRTASEVRNAFTRGGGNLGGANSVAHLFQEKGIVIVKKENAREDQLLECALEAGAEDVRDEGEIFEVLSTPQDLQKVRLAIEKVVPKCETELRMVPNASVPVSGADAESIVKLLNSLEDLDDVQQVIANFEMDSAEMERLGARESA